VHAVIQRWMDPDGDGDPSDGIDGWRLDVAEMVELNFWRELRRWVKQINPNAYLTGEVWWEDWPNNKIFNAAPWLQGDAFDAVMNYRFAKAVKKFVIDVEKQISVQEFADSIQAIHRDYPKENLYVLQNLMDSHDVDRLASQIVNPDRWYDHEAHPGQNEAYNIRKPNETERKKQRLIVAMQMTMPGAPMIYYGDEAGMWGGDDPDCRKPMVWPELEYETETAHPLGKSRPADEVYFDEDLFDWYRKLIGIRKSNPSLSLGEIEFFLLDEKNKNLGYRRSFEDESLFVVINNRPAATTLQLTLQHEPVIENVIRDLISGETYTSHDRIFLLELTAYQIIILRNLKP
ncbi:MAG: alpha-amylase family glycosyl hydrolase, partial [bacterium]